MPASETEVEDVNAGETGTDEGRDATPPTPEKPKPSESGRESALRKEREEKAAIKKQLLAFQRDKEEQDRKAQEERDRELPELERLRKAVSESAREKAEAEKRALKVQEELVRERIAARVEREAAKVFDDPTLAPQLVDYSRLEYDPDSKDVVGIKDEFDRILKKHAGLARGASAARGGTPPRDGGRQAQSQKPPKEVDPDAEAFALGGIS